MGESIRVSFGSRSELACAMMLERYVGWKAEVGISCQIDILGRKVDFRIGDTLIEYHPTSLPTAFTSREAFKMLKSSLRKVDKHTRSNILEAVKKELTGQYHKQRKILLSSSIEYSNCSLIVCTSAEDFIDLVLRKFSKNKLQGTAELMNEWKELRNSVGN